MKLTKDQFEQLPDSLKPSFIAVGDIYVDQEHQELSASLSSQSEQLEIQKKHFNELSQKFTQSDEALKQLNEAMELAKAQKAAEIEQEVNIKLEEARKGQKTDDLIKAHQEQVDLIAKNHKAAIEKLKNDHSALIEAEKQNITAQLTKQFELKNLSERKKAEVSKAVLSLNPLDQAAAELMSLALEQSIGIDEEAGSISYKSKDGGLYSDFNLWLEAQKNNPIFSHLIKADIPTSGGGGAGGSDGSHQNKEPKSLKELNSLQRVDLFNNNPELYKKLQQSTQH